MQIDYLQSRDGLIHAINCRKEGSSLNIGILCLVSFHEETTRISDEQQSFIVEVPSEFHSRSEKVKVFNCKDKSPNILSCFLPCACKSMVAG